MDYPPGKRVTDGKPDYATTLKIAARRNPGVCIQPDCMHICDQSNYMCCECEGNEDNPCLICEERRALDS